jgi:hypothetical protein
MDLFCSVCSKTLEMTGIASKEVSQAAAGISISLDKIVSVLQDENSSPAVDVVVCSVGHRSMEKEKAAVIRELWAAGIKSSLIDSLQVPCVPRSVNPFTVHVMCYGCFCLFIVRPRACKSWHAGGGT